MGRMMTELPRQGKGDNANPRFGPTMQRLPNAHELKDENLDSIPI